MGLYIDSTAAKKVLGEDFDCLPPISLEHNQALAEREFPATCKHSYTDFVDMGSYMVFCSYMMSCKSHQDGDFIVWWSFDTGLMASNNIEKTIRIVVTSGLVNQGRFSKGLRESLEPRIEKVGP